MFPACCVIVMLFIEQLVLIVSADAVQFVVLNMLLSCKIQPLEGHGQDTARVLPERLTVNAGAAGGSTAAWAVHIPPPLASTAAHLLPSADETMDVQFWAGALVCVQVPPELVEM